MFDGLAVAMVTPFRDGKVDWDAVDGLLDHLLEGGVDGIVPGGSTGEGPTLQPEERRELIRRASRRAEGKAFILAGTGTNSTDGTIKQTLMAKEEGADGALVVVPYYNKPTQAGLRAHFLKVADECDIPLCLYNVPGRSAVALTTATIRQLSEHPRIVAIKESSGSLDQATEICRETRLTLLSGDDSLALPTLAVGGRGVVSVVGNFAPKPIKRMLDLFQAGEIEEARRLHHELYALSRAMFIETNPGPIKHALARCGLIREELRLPLVPVAESSASRIDEVLSGLPPEWMPRKRGGA
jgi:4-hydroxy-tetrahydrodipicolinate synthase